MKMKKKNKKHKYSWIYEFWHNEVKPKFGEKTKLCYMDTDNVIVYKITDNIYVDIATDAETWFDTSNYGLEIPLAKGKK